jgi:hypothetical protein
MNAFYEHHQTSIRFGYRCFDRILLNGLIQPFQQPERVVGFFSTYRDQYPVSRDLLRHIAEQFQNSVKNRSEKWNAPTREAPQGRRDEFVEPYFRHAKPDQLVVILNHVRKSIGRHEIGSAFRGSSALHAVGDSYLLLTRPAPQLATIELRFQFRYAAAQPPRLLQLDPRTLWFSSTQKPPPAAPPRRKVEKTDITQALADVGDKVRFNQLRDQIMNATECSKRTAQLAIAEACQQGWIARANGQYHLPL